MEPESVTEEALWRAMSAMGRHAHEIYPSKLSVYGPLGDLHARIVAERDETRVALERWHLPAATEGMSLVEVATLVVGAAENLEQERDQLCAEVERLRAGILRVRDDLSDDGYIYQCLDALVEERS